MAYVVRDDITSPEGKDDTMKLKRAAAILGAAEMARQWVRNNPDAARKYIDTAAGAVDKRTHGKYSTKVQGARDAAKNAVAKESGTSEAASATVSGQTGTGSSNQGGPAAG